MAVTNAGVLAGTGGTGAVVVGGTSGDTAGGTITAGTGPTAADTPGTLATGNLNFNGGPDGGALVVKFAGSTAATGGTAATWDLLAAGTINLSSLSAANPFGLTAIETSANGFTTTTAKSFLIASGSGVTLNGKTFLAAGTDVSYLFDLDTTSIGIDESRFGVAVSSGGLALTFAGAPEPIPEPASVTLGVVGAVVVLRRRRRRA